MSSKKNKVQVPEIVSNESPIKQIDFISYIVVGLSLLVILLTIIGRINLLEVPLSRDEGTYGLLGKLAMNGKIPYLDFYEMKPPVLYYSVGIGGQIFGFSDTGYRIFLLMVNVVSSFLLYAICKKYTSIKIGAIAAAIFSMLSLNLYAFGFALVAEHIVNLFIILSLYFILVTEHKYKLILAGVTFALALFTKQTAILISPVIALLIYFQSDNFKHFITNLLWLTAGVLSVTFMVLLFLIITGSLNEALFWIWTYPSKYSDGIAWSEGKDYFKMFFNKIFNFNKWTLISSGITSIIALVFIKNNYIKAAILYLILTIAGIFPGNRFYGQYWLPIFPALSLLTAFSLHSLFTKWNKFSALILIIPLLLLIDYSRNKNYFFAQDKHQEILKLYKGNPFEAMKKLSEYAKKIIKKDETFMVFGSEPQLYLYADKMPVTNHVFMGMMSRNTEKSKPFADEVIKDLETKKPDYILYNLVSYSWMLKDDSDENLYHRTFNAIKNDYIPIAAYNVAQKKYYFENEKSKIDFYLPEQITLLKRN